MTHDELIEAAAKAAYESWIEDVRALEPSWEELPSSHRDRMRRSIAAAAPLIRADERAKGNEACARVAEKPHEHGGDGWAAKHEVALANALSEGIAAAIRARMGGE